MNKSKLNALLLTSLAMMDNNFMASGNDDDMTLIIPKSDKPPSGTKQYWFDIDGNFSSESMRRDEVVYQCFAINDKNAKRKYNLWKSQNK